MLKAPKHATTNFRAILPYLNAADKNEGHIKLESSGYMPLVVENLYFTDFDGREVYSISHYGEQNGDLMADPDMEIAVDKEKGTVYPRTFRNDYMGIMQEVFIFKNGKTLYSHRLLTDLDDFLWHWLKNIKDQGFVA